MSKVGAQAKREANKLIKPAPGPKRLSYLELHELVCGCKREVTDGQSLCMFGDGWLDAA